MIFFRRVGLLFIFDVLFISSSSVEAESLNIDVTEKDTKTSEISIKSLERKARVSS